MGITSQEYASFPRFLGAEALSQALRLHIDLEGKSMRTLGRLHKMHILAPLCSPLEIWSPWVGAGPRDLNSNKQLVYGSHFEKNCMYYVHVWSHLTCDGKVKSEKKKVKILGKNAGSLGSPGGEYAPFPHLLGAEGKLSITHETGKRQAKGYFFSFMILFSNVKEHLGKGGGGTESRVGRGGKEEEGAALPDCPWHVKYAWAFAQLSNVRCSVGWPVLALEPGGCVF